MFFSEYYKIDISIIEKYGAVDISFVCDFPLFIDPMLIFNSEKNEYKELHKKIVKYFHFLYIKKQSKVFRLKNWELGLNLMKFLITGWVILCLEIKGLLWENGMQNFYMRILDLQLVIIV